MPEKVLVTGASGYIAAWVIKYLLEDGYIVNATVRDKNNLDKIQHLIDFQLKFPSQLHIFDADLIKKDSFKESMKDCDYVIHTASPFIISGIKDPQKELVEPALEGTRNVLNTVNETPSVKRVVLTSSVVSIYGDALDLEDTRNGIFDETIWNTTSSLGHQPYSYSKKLAEKEAWDINSKQNRWDLVTINPGFVLGPSITNRVDSTSIDFMINMLNGKLKTGVPKLSLGVVDVRSVARAHVNAIKIKEAKGRYILVSETLSMKEIANILTKKYGDKFKIPKNELPNFMIYAVAPFIDFTWKYIKRNVDKPLKFDNSKSKKELSINYSKPEQTIIDHSEQLIKNGTIK